MGMTITEKILAQHSPKKEVHAGDIVECDVSTAVMVELTFAGLRKPKRVWDPKRSGWSLTTRCRHQQSMRPMTWCNCASLLTKRALEISLMSAGKE